MLSKRNPLNVNELQMQQVQRMYQDCEMGVRGACHAFKDDKYKSLLEQAMQAPRQYAEGGEVEDIEESLLAPPEMGDTNEQEVYEEDPLLPLAEVLGEEGYMQVLAAIADYPIIATVADMAIKTGEGFVEGQGGPKEDLVPARLSDGEYVFSAEAVEALGPENLEALHEQGKKMAASQL